jgi:hypothetical protein
MEPVEQLLQRAVEFEPLHALLRHQAGALVDGDLHARHFCFDGGEHGCDVSRPCPQICGRRGGGGGGGAGAAVARRSSGAWGRRRAPYIRPPGVHAKARGYGARLHARAALRVWHAVLTIPQHYRIGVPSPASSPAPSTFNHPAQGNSPEMGGSSAILPPPLITPAPAARSVPRPPAPRAPRSRRGSRAPRRGGTGRAAARAG